MMRTSTHEALMVEARLSSWDEGYRFGKVVGDGDGFQRGWVSGREISIDAYLDGFFEWLVGSDAVLIEECEEAREALDIFEYWAAQLRAVMG